MIVKVKLFRKSTILVLIAALILSMFQFFDAVRVQAAEGYKVVGYYPSWGAYGRNYLLSDIDASKVTHLKTIISVGGWSWSNRFSDVAATAATREVFANSAVDFLRKYQFDGIDLDWEYPVGGGLAGNSYRPADKQNHTLLLQAVRDKLNTAGTADGKHYLLTIASGASPTYIQNTELSNIASIVNWINIMTYDFHGGFDPISGNNAALTFDPADPSPNKNSYYDDAAITNYLNPSLPSKK